MIKPQTSSLAYTRQVAALTPQSVAETKFTASEFAGEVLAVCPQVSLLTCEVASGRVNYSGKLIITLVYADEEGKMCRIQKGAEFSHFCDNDNLAPAQTAVCALSCDKTNVRREGSSFVVSAIITAQISVFAPAERTYISACEGAYLKTRSAELCSSITFSGECEVEDDFDADGVEDILLPAASAIVTSAECGTGEINVSGDINLSMLAMRRSSPASMERVIPFRCTVACEDSPAGALPLVNAEVRDMTVNATVDGERGKCRVEFSCTLAVSGSFVLKSEVPLPCDAFSCENRLIATKESETFDCVGERKLFSERISSAAATSAKLDFTCRFLAVALPSAEYEYCRASGAVEGSANAVLIYEQGGEIRSSEIKIPFAVRVGAPDSDEISVSAAVCGVSVKQPVEGQAEGEALLKISVCYMRKTQAEYLSSLEEGDALQPSDGAISVLIPSRGDGLWDAARKLNCPPDELASANPDIKYPLTGKERLLIYRIKTG